MIIHIERSETTTPLFDELVSFYDAFVVEGPEQLTVITSSKIKELEPRFQSLAKETFVFESDIQLASKDYVNRRQINIGDHVFGDGKTTTFVAGPCSVESREQITTVARAVKAQGGSFFRAGAYKPRTSPYSFQGLGKEGVLLLREVCDEQGLKLVSEVRDATHVDVLLEHADIVQIGTKAMYDQGVLRACGRTQVPVLLKRGFGTTLQEFVQAAEFIMSSGNPNVILCERGLRTFETKTRFTLDLCGVAYLKQHINLPVVVDPSHAMGYAYGVPDLAVAAFAMGVDGLLVEVHPDPSVAKSDASQQLTVEEYQALQQRLKRFEDAAERRLV